jgi:hypothetical protein
VHSWGEREFPVVITVFSAPNYCDSYMNKAAIIVFQVPHPLTLEKPNDNEAIQLHHPPLHPAPIHERLRLVVPLHLRKNLKNDANLINLRLRTPKNHGIIELPRPNRRTPGEAHRQDEGEPGSGEYAGAVPG